MYSQHLRLYERSFTKVLASRAVALWAIIARFTSRRAVRLQDVTLRLKLWRYPAVHVLRNFWRCWRHLLDDVRRDSIASHGRSASINARPSKPISQLTMPPVRSARTRKAPPAGFDEIEDMLLDFANKMKDAESAPHEGKKKNEATWDIFRISHQSMHPPVPPSLGPYPDGP